ncbi:hypothetical protein GF325_16575 [Candidatus Bathyarchaeota archaeon]|nr:hypothetical protein [Candidatus Bathyarchaeota archaeon]
MVKVKIPEKLAPECRECKEAVITEWEAKELSIEGKDEVTVPFRIHVDQYDLDSTKFKLIDYKSIAIESRCPSCREIIKANLLFDDEGRSFGIFTERIQDRYLFQHSPGITDKEAYMKRLLELDYID